MSMLATLFIGSPRGPRSTSDALGTYLLERLREQGADTNKIYIQQSLNSQKGIDVLLSAVAEADIMVLASPLYADSHHSGVIRAMELVLEDRKNRANIKRQKMAAISNSGFPEARHNDLSLAISKTFARECGFEWAGGLALGGGASIAGRPLEEAGGLVRNVKKSLALAADALAKGEAIPGEAVKLMARPLMPRWLYLLIGNRGWVRSAKKHGCKERLGSRVYRD